MADCSECESLKSKLDEQVALTASKDINIKNLKEKLEGQESELTELRAFKESTEEQLQKLLADQAETKALAGEKEELEQKLEALTASFETIKEKRKEELLGRIEAAGLDTGPYMDFDMSTLEVVSEVLVSMKTRKEEVEGSASGARPTRVTASKPAEDDFDYEAIKKEEQRLLSGVAS